MNKLIKFKYKLDKNTHDFFKKNGYIIYKNIISKKEIDDFKSELSNIIKSYCKKNFTKLKYKSFDDWLNKPLIYMSKSKKTGIGEIYDTIFNTPSFLEFVVIKK